MNARLPRVYLVRHGETEWSALGKHTGRSDIPLTPTGQHDAQWLGERMREVAFVRVLSSPLERARRTCELAGFGDRMEIDPDLVEVDYGQYEGQRTDEIRSQRPGWNVFIDGCPGGESVAQISARADRVVERLRGFSPGDILVFSHRHFLQCLAVRWIDLPTQEARRFTLGTTSLSVLSYYRTRKEPVIERWNDTCHLDPEP